MTGTTSHSVNVNTMAAPQALSTAREAQTVDASRASGGAALRVFSGSVRDTESLPDEASPFGFELVSRPHFEDLHESVLQTAVTLLEAPAGFGKTAVLWQWYRQARRMDVDAVRLKMDAHSSDAVHFLAELNEALERVGAHVEIRGSGPDGAASKALWQGLHQPCLVLIDDYPIDPPAELDQLFGALTRDTPPELHIVIAARVPVRWPLCKLLLKGHAQRLEREQLRFTREEVAHYLAARHPTEEDLQSLEEVVQGWPAAMHILQLSQEQEPTTSFKRLAQRPPDLAARYVREQVLGHLPKPVIDLLLMTAALEGASVALLDALRGAHDSDVLLRAAIEHGIPLVTDDGAAGWISLHPFVNTCLGSEVMRLGPIRRRDLHLRAQKWLFEQGDIEKAAHHTKLAGDARGLFEMIESAGGVRIVMRDGTSAVTRILEQLPLQLAQQFPRASMARALLLAKRGHLQEARRVLESVGSLRCGLNSAQTPADEDLWLAEYFVAFYEDTLDSTHDEDRLTHRVQSAPGTDPWLRSVLHLELSRAQFRRGRLTNAIESALEAEFWGNEASTPYAEFFVALHLGILNLHRGSLRIAREYFARAEKISADAVNEEPHLQILSDVLGAGAYYETDEVDTAARMLARSMPRVHQSECCVDGYVAAHVIASLVELGRNGLSAAMTILTRGAEISDQHRFPRLAHAMKVQRAALLAATGKSEEALAQLVEAGVRLEADEFIHPSQFTWLERIHDGLVLARACLVAGETTQALNLAQRLDAECERAGNLRFALRARLLRALAHRALGDSESVNQTLLSALAMAVPEGARRPFLDEGAQMLDLLRALVRNGGITQLQSETVGFIASLIGALSSEPAQTQPTGSPRVAGSILSPREYEVLEALAGGHSNKTIARKLDLTENTVKFHLRSLYEKLGVGCRVLAVAVAREKGMLPA